ncbi:MAG TPA: hypothetical protein VGP65_04815 [Candidatus Angelobacter sp.]|nr:hypothetical protein [Candidatus Angelobacter sp.]
MSPTIFGIPFGNSPRNALVDAPSIIANMTVIKSIKLGENANFEMRLTANNVFNHFNFLNVDPFLDDAGKGLFGTDFANPKITSAKRAYRVCRRKESPSNPGSLRDLARRLQTGGFSF